MAELNMVEELDKLRNFVHSLGWMDEGSEEQARDILSNLGPITLRVVQATAHKHPELFKEMTGRGTTDLDNLAEGIDRPDDEE